jgi:TolB-like protein/cytochrome c-type biogenesis protein CcmH/NrfG
MSLITELKRRNVFRVGIAYLALGWIVTQVTTTVAPMLHLPEWVGPVVLWIGVIAFPFVVMFAWIYELTPEGIKRESEVDPSASVTHHTARRLDYAIIALLVLAIGLFAFHEFRPARDTGVTLVARTTPGTVPATAGADRSVAVLPFVDMSAGKDQEYFADGISEELLNLLAKIPQLRVIARTSSFSFKGKEVDISEIAKKLNVANVLEGSVRKSGDTLRITAQLIRASDSSHLWSQTYDRKMTDVFTVQDEIAAAVVEQLKVTLLGAAPKARVTNPKAYALFLQARQLSRQYSAASLEQAIALYKQALGIDPAYAPAWNGLAVAYFGQMDLGVLTIDQGFPLGKEAIQKALEHDPSFAPAYGTQAIFDAIIGRDYPAAVQHLERGLALDPANIENIGIAGAVARRLGRLDLAIALGEYKVAHDPVAIEGYDDLGLAYRYNGQLDESIASYRKLLSMAPDAGWERTALGTVLLQKGEAEAALVEFQKEPIEVYRLGGLAMAYQVLGRKAESDAAFSELRRKYPDTKPFSMAVVMTYRGDLDGAFEMLEKADRIHDIDAGAMAMFPTFAPLHKDPRWLPLLRRLGLAPEQLAAIKFDISVPKQ